MAEFRPLPRRRREVNMTEDLDLIAQEESPAAELESLLEKLDAECDRPDWLANVHTMTLYVNKDIAQQFLARNVEPELGKPGTNRPEVTGGAATIRDDIISGDWVFNHQGIGFDTNGNLIDGAHRMRAIIRAAEQTGEDLEVPIQVTWGLPPKSNEKMDLQRRRSPGTYLAMAGKANGNRMATIAKLVHRYETANFDDAFSARHWNADTSLKIVREVVAAHPLIDEANVWAGRLMKKITASAGGAAYLLLREKYSQALVDEFFEGIITGANLPEGDARLALIRWRENQRMNVKVAYPPVHLAVTLKAFAAFRNRTPVSAMTFKPSVERFPRA